MSLPAWRQRRLGGVARRGRRARVGARVARRRRETILAGAADGYRARIGCGGRAGREPRALVREFSPDLARAVRELARTTEPELARTGRHALARAGERPRRGPGG